MDHQPAARSEKVYTKDINELVRKAYQRGSYVEALEELDLGYLRSGTVLLQNKKIILAMKMYERGIQKVSADDPGLQVLQQMLHKVTRKVVGGERKDPLDLLPIELSSNVFTLLDLTSLCRCLRVSHSWNTYLRNESRLWRTLDLRATRKRVSLKVLESFLQRSRGLVETLIVGDVTSTGIFTGRGGSAIQTLVQRCPRLQHLEIFHPIQDSHVVECARLAPLLTRIIICDSCPVDVESLCSILNNSPDLVHAEFRYIRVPRLNNNLAWGRNVLKLKHLSLKAGPECHLSRIIGLALSKLIPLMPELETFELIDWSRIAVFAHEDLDFSSLEMLRNLKIEIDDLNSWPYALPQSLESLTIRRGYRICLEYRNDNLWAGSGINCERRLSMNFPALKSLDLEGVTMRDIKPFEMMLSTCSSSLRQLFLNSCNFAKAIILVLKLAEMGILQNLTHLSLQSFPDFDDDAAGIFVDGAPALTHANFSAAPNLTGCGVKDLILKKGAKLVELNLVSCENVSIDAIEWAEDQGVEVHGRIRRYRGHPAATKLRLN